MQKDDQKGGKFYFKWPWNVVVYVILVFLLRIFSIPVILLIMAWNKKQQPEGPEEGYCLQRTRRRLARLVWAALFLLIGIACGTVFMVQVTGDRSGWEAMDYVTLAVAGVIGLGGIAGGLYEGYTDLRDAFFPERSRLAQSIRSQLPYPEEAPGVKELFSMVDQDIKDNGQWFDRVAVGKEWVLGDDASYIPRIRAVFGRDEVVHHHSNGRTQTRRIVELYILDDRRQVQVTSLRNPNELPALLDCLKLRAPGAVFCSYQEYPNYCGKSDEEWDALERDYRRRQGQRAAQAVSASPLPIQNMVLTLPDGSVTSRITPELVQKTLFQSVEQGSGVFFLTPGQPVSAEGRSFTELACTAIDCTDWEDWSDEEPSPIELVLKQAPEQAGQPPQNGFLLETDVKQAQDILLTWLRGQAPSLTCWQPVPLYIPQPAQGQGQEAPPARLALTTAQGANREHRFFTREDVEVVAGGLVDGSYRMADLLLTGGYLWIQVITGDKTDGRCTVTATRADPDKLRFFRTRCTHRRAAAWLLDYYDGTFRPQGKEWKDVTKQVLKK